MGFLSRIKSRFNVFKDADDNSSLAYDYNTYGPVMVYGNQSPYRNRSFVSGERSIIASIYNRIAVDCSMVDIYHIKKDKEGRYSGIVSDGIQECLTISANVDQTGSHFRRDVFLSILEAGVIAIVAVDTSDNPNETGSFDVESLRVGTITQWYPRHVMVNLYDDRTGIRRDVIFRKDVVAIVENPFYSIMNEPNSTYQRLVRKLNMLDAIDEQTSSGKLDIIIQLPYVVKNDRKMKEAAERAESIQTQLKDSKYGIAYIDGTEKITQLNRPAENNLLKQVESLTEMLYEQLGITKDVLSGIADEETMMHYQEKTLRPLLVSVTESLNRTFLSKTARTQGHSIEYYQDPFSLVPVTKLAELADKFSRNEIMTGNELRGILAMRPSDDSRADMLLNKNLPTPENMLDESEKPKAIESGELSSNAEINIERILKKESDRQNGR